MTWEDGTHTKNTSTGTNYDETGKTATTRVNMLQIDRLEKYEVAIVGPPLPVVECDVATIPSPCGMDPAPVIVPGVPKGPASQN